MKFKKVCCLALAFATFATFTACQTENEVKAEDLIIPTYEDAGEMMLRADLPPNASSREQMELYKECGFNAIPLTEDNFSAAEVAPYMEELKKYNEALVQWNGAEETKPIEPKKPDYIKALELCEELDIDALIRPHSKYTAKAPDSVVGQPNYFEEYFYNTDFRNYPAVKGFMVCDEPTYGQVTDLINRYLPWFNENYGGENFELLINHNGPHSSAWKDSFSKTKTYEEFINYYNDGFLSKLNSVNKTLSFDTYVLYNDGANNYVHDTFLSSCLDVRKYAEQFGVDFGGYIQCFTGYSTLRDPSSYADFTFQVGTYLAFGAKRLSFYGYRDNLPEKHIVTGGEPNQKWYWVQDVNTMIKKLDGILFNFDWEGIYTNIGTGSFFAVNEAFEAIKNEDLDSLSGVKTFSSKYDAIVGQFKDGNGNNGFMLVNYEEPSLTTTNKVTMTFDTADGVLYYRNGEPVVEALKNKTFSIDLAAGEGVFVIPLYTK